MSVIGEVARSIEDEATQFGYEVAQPGAGSVRVTYLGRLRVMATRIDDRRYLVAWEYDDKTWMAAIHDRDEVASAVSRAVQADITQQWSYR